MPPRKYLETTTLVAIWDQAAGISQLSWRNRISPLSLTMLAERSSHSMASKGWTPSVVKRRGTVMPRSMVSGARSTRVSPARWAAAGCGRAGRAAAGAISVLLPNRTPSPAACNFSLSMRSVMSVLLSQIRLGAETGMFLPFRAPARPAPVACRIPVLILAKA